MRLRFPTLSLFLFLIVLLETRAAQWTVEIYDFYFTPTNLTVGLGDTVTWVNRVTRPHDTTQFDPRNPDTLLWASDLLGKDQTFSHTFTSLGTFPYVCAVHFAQRPEQTGTVSVVQANLPPSVNITNPASGAIFSALSKLTIGASAMDEDGTITRVEFFIDGTSVAVLQSPPFIATVDSLSPGNHVLTAVARDNSGANTTSASVNITFQEAPMKFALTLGIQPPNAGAVSINPPPPVDDYDSGTVITLTAGASNGFAFAGWSGAVNSTANPLMLTMDSSRTLVANFSPTTTPSYALTILTNPTGAGTVTIGTAPNGPNGTYLEGTVVSLVASPSPEFIFTNWSGAVLHEGSSLQIEMRSNTVVSANFIVSDVRRFTISFRAVPPNLGSVSINPPPGLDGRYAEGTVVTLEARAHASAEFLGWSGDAMSSSNTLLVLIDSDKSVTANFASVSLGHLLALGTNPAGGGGILVSPAPRPNGTYAPATTIGAAAMPNVGFRFVRWQGQLSSTNNPLVFTTPAVALTPRDPLTLTAVFEPIPSLDFSRAAGRYAGLLLDEAGSNSSTNVGTEYSTLGFLSIRIARTGAFRGTAIIGGIRQAIAGQFDRFGYAPLVLRQGTLSGSMQIGGHKINGLLTDGVRRPALMLSRAMNPTNVPAFAGTYHFTVGANDVVTEEGMGTVRISANGQVRLRGRWGDGTGFAARTFLSHEAGIPLFVPLYGKRGAALGWLETSVEGTVAGSVRWLRPGDSRNQKYPHGFVLEVPVFGGLATAAANRTPRLLLPLMEEPFCRPGPLSLAVRRALLSRVSGSRLL